MRAIRTWAFVTGFVVGACCAPAVASDFYDVTIIASTSSQANATGRLGATGLGFNDDGDIIYYQDRFVGGAFIGDLYRRDGQTGVLSLMVTAPGTFTVNDPSANNNRVVAYTYGTPTGPEVRLWSPGGSSDPAGATTLCPNPALTQLYSCFSDTLSDNLRVMGRRPVVGNPMAIISASGVQAEVAISEANFGVYNPVISRDGNEAAWSGGAGGRTNSITVIDPTVTGGSGHYTFPAPSPYNIVGMSINNRGLAAFNAYRGALNSTLLPLVGVVDIRHPANGVIRVADDASGRFTDFSSGARGSPAINGWNEVAFTASESGNANVGVFVGDVGGNEPRPVVTNGEVVSTADGTYFSNVMQGGMLPQSINEHGEIAFFGYVVQPSTSSLRPAVLLAKPKTGMSPANPVQPEPGPPLAGGGWRFPIDQFGVLVGGPVMRFVDPAIATGYDYAVDAGGPNFTSVYVPAPLPNGDAEFQLEFAGQIVPLLAGARYDMTALAPGGVGTFRITGIDTTEALDAANPMAFVTGLTFSDPSVAHFTMTMTPIVDAGPTISQSLTGAQGANGWYTGDVTITWTVASAAGPVTSQSGCDTAVISIDTAGQALTCTATSSGGTTSQTVTIRRDATAPTASGTLSPLPNGNGWNNTNVLAHFSGGDATSGLAGCSADQMLSAEMAGQSASGTCTDMAGNTSAATVLGGVNIDKTAPAISGSRSPPAPASGWNNVPVTVSFSATDSLSTVAANGCTAPVTVATDGRDQSVTGSCSDLAGNAASTTVSAISIDRTPPSAQASATPAPNAAGWNNGNVTVTFSGADSLSGSGLGTCSPPATVAGEGAALGASGTCTDQAGNVSAPATASFRIDRTAPTASVMSPTGGASYPSGAVVLAGYDCSDALSGIPAAQCIGTVASGSPIDTTGSGVKSFVVNAVDLAGNAASPLVVNYTVTPVASGDSTAPVIAPLVSGPLGSNGWYRGNVSIAWRVTDPESAVSSTSGCATVLLTRDTAGTTYTCQASSAGGSASASVTIKRDSTTPTVNVASPDDRAYRRNSILRATYSCRDALAGIAACAAPVASGGLLDTSSAGRKSLTVTATDSAGNAKTVTVRYTVL